MDVEKDGYNKQRLVWGIRAPVFPKPSLLPGPKSQTGGPTEAQQPPIEPARTALLEWGGCGEIQMSNMRGRANKERNSEDEPVGRSQDQTKEKRTSRVHPTGPEIHEGSVPGDWMAGYDWVGHGARTCGGLGSTCCRRNVETGGLRDAIQTQD
jgi:hypothetical protein